MDRLQWLQPLAGGTWTAEGVVPGLGDYWAERVYTWVLGGQFLAERHAMDLGPHSMRWESVIGWDSSAGKLMEYSFANDGSITISELTMQDGELLIEGERRGGLRPGPLRRRMRPCGTDQFTEVVEASRRGEWARVLTLEFARRSPAAMLAGV